MGRKGGGGGTAGGGRSGKKGNVTYTRVVPKFLQRLADPHVSKDPLDAKRPWARGHLGTNRRSDDEPPKEQTQKSESIDPQDEVASLQAEGFNVVVENETLEPEKEKEASVTKAEPSRSSEKDSGKLHGRVEKRKHTSRATLNKIFDKRNMQMLSFDDSDSDDD